MTYGLGGLGRPFAFICLAAAVLLAGQPADARDADTVAAEQALGRFNGAMLGLYADARAAMLAAERPLILVGAQIALITQGGSEVEEYVPPLYNHLKAFAHVTLGLAGALLPEGTDRAAKLGFLRDELAELRPHVTRLDLTPVQAARQVAMIDLIDRFIGDALAAPRVDRAALAALMRVLRPMLLDNAREAAVAQLDRLHAVVTRWRDSMAPEAWARVRVLVAGPRTPRPQNLQVAYFLRLLGEPAEGGRVIYTESVYDPQGMQNQLGVLLVDRALSSLVFGSPSRMEADLLGFVAADYLDRLLP